MCTDNEEIIRLRNAVNTAIVALDDWINIYAEEFCNAKRVAEAKARINARGTLAYVADVVYLCKESLK